jgi:hypothetical protein
MAGSPQQTYREPGKTSESHRAGGEKLNFEVAHLGDGDGNFMGMHCEFPHTALARSQARVALKTRI